MTTENELVSIILPVYNAEKFIESTIMSVLNQSYLNIECIVIDDGSTDNTNKIINQLMEKDERLKYYKQENEGICSARNLGLQKINGEYVCFCDHDDEYARNYIETSIGLIKALRVDVICSAYKEIEIKDNIIIKDEIRIPSDKNLVWDVSNIFRDYWSYQHTFTTIWNCLYTKKALVDFKFDERLRFGGEDVLFNLRILQRGFKVGKNDAISYYHYKRYGQSASSKFNDNRIDSLLICLNEEINIILQSMNKDRYLVATSEQYYLGGILKLIKTHIATFSYSNFRTLMTDICNSRYFKWKKDFVVTKLGIKYNICYLFFCKSYMFLLYLLCKIS